MRIQGNDLNRDSFKEQMMDGLNTLNSHLNELNKTLQVIASNLERKEISEADVKTAIQEHDSELIEELKSTFDQNHLSDY